MRDNKRLARTGSFALPGKQAHTLSLTPRIIGMISKKRSAKRMALGVAAVLAVIYPGEMLAQTAPNNSGTRQPLTCQPVRSLPNNAAQIVRLIQCARESEDSGTVTLLENVSVEFGTTRKYQYFSDSGFYGIDTTAPVMPLRGSLDRYICSPITRKVPDDVYSVDTLGKNCMIVHERKATGACIHTTFGDWTCTMMEAVDPDEWAHDQPPPRQ